MKQNGNRTGRRLTYEELKAAEDAFQGRPFNKASSEAARTVYVGILVAKMKLHRAQVPVALPVLQRESQRQKEPLVPAGKVGGVYRL